MTTRRRRRALGAPWRGRTGRLGLFEPELAISSRLSVDPGQFGVDPHAPPQRAREAAARGRALEARQAPARVHAPSGAAIRLDERPVRGNEADELGLRRPAPAT